MSAAVPGKPFGPVNAWPDPDTKGKAARWLYVPRAPSPQRNSAGRVQLTMIEVGETLMLTLGTNLSVDEPALAEARSAIAQANGGRAEDIDLRPAPTQASGARLLLESKDAEPLELARARPSPGVPHSAAFSAMLRGDGAKAALKQGTGRLTVAYDLDLAGQRKATATVRGDPGDERDIESAIAAGRLELATTADEGASSALKDQAVRAAMAAARNAMAALPVASDCADYKQTRAIDAQATRTEPDLRRVTLVADIADWL